MVKEALLPCPRSPNCVSSMTNATDLHYIEPFSYNGIAEEAFGRLEKILDSLSYVDIVEREKNYLRCVATTKIFRFKDDLEFLHKPAESLIHVRSASRVGYSDLGKNRSRVEDIRQAFLKHSS